MASIEENSAQINVLTVFMNAIIADSKTIDELPDQGSLVNTSEIAVRNAGVTEKTTVQKIIDGSNGVKIFIDSLPFVLLKHNLNNVPANRLILETNDTVIGYDNLSNMMYAIYLGGDSTDFQNVAVYNNVSGWDAS